jgi:two-component system cell cycle response regulator
MLVLVAHGSATTRRRLGRTLRGAGHTVFEAGGIGAAMLACRAERPDVLLVSLALAERDRRPVVELVKGDPEIFRTAVVLIVDGPPDPVEGAALLERGAQDFLLASAGEAELIARVGAAGRMKLLQEEYITQTSRLESRLFEDPLTRLFNRRFLFAQLEAHVSAARRHGRRLSVTVIDLDRFKDYNDTHGHPAGDRLLVAVAGALRSSTRAEDVIGRYGGVVLLPDTGRHAAARAAERQRAAIARACEDQHITASVGWATLEDGEAGDSLVRRADDALYAAKDAGRDRVRAAAGSATLRDRT